MLKGKISKKEREIIKNVLKNQHNIKHIKKDIIITEGVILALPLLITFVLYINLILKTATTLYDVGERLSPTNTEPLLTFMLMFIIVYSIFLIFMYRKMRLEISA